MDSKGHIGRTFLAGDAMCFFISLIPATVWVVPSMLNRMPASLLTVAL